MCAVSLLCFKFVSGLDKKLSKKQKKICKSFSKTLVGIKKGIDYTLDKIIHSEINNCFSYK